MSLAFAAADLYAARVFPLFLYASVLAGVSSL
jgi:hypothetical protein